MRYYYEKFAVDIFPDKKDYDLLHGRCSEVQFSISGNSYNSIFSDFKIHVDNYLAKEKEFKLAKEKEFEYKGYILKLGVIETRKYGYCEELDYKTYGEDEETNITKFKKFINWRVSNSKKEDKSYSHLLTQLDRLVRRDKENNFTPFELRRQLIEIYHLFGNILSLTLEDIYKLYFERFEE